MDESKMNSPTPGPNRVMGGSEDSDGPSTLKAATKEEELVSALGITMMDCHMDNGLKKPPTDQHAGRDEHVVVPDPHADDADLSDVRGIKAPTKGPQEILAMKTETENDELEALAELVPELKSKATKERENHTMTVDVSDQGEIEVVGRNKKEADEDPIEVNAVDAERQISVEEKTNLEEQKAVKAVAALTKNDSMHVHESGFESSSSDADYDDDHKPAALGAAVAAVTPILSEQAKAPIVASGDEDQNLGGFDNVDSDDALNSDDGVGTNNYRKATAAVSKPADETYPNISSGASLSTATQTHEVRMPMYLPTFKPATGCTNASDFIVRCFVARLRSGITVVKHGRSRWCKSRLRILHIHPDGRSLSWKPAVGEPTSSKRPPKLDLSTCEEVRHAWSPDPLNPMFTGTPILRQKCEAANAHKSFALIFPKRTVDITAVTADQCKVLMEGFSALCFRLQVANLAGRGAKKGKSPPEEEEVATTTASVTLTNNSATGRVSINNK